MKLALKQRRKLRAFTIVELLVATMIMAVVGAVAYYSLQSGLILSAKNLSLTRSHETLRSALDRLAHQVQVAQNVPTLINTNGATVTTGPAAGLKYDRLIGEPYVLDPPLTAGSISSGDTSLKIWRSTTATGAPPIPTVGDVLMIDTENGTIRSRITSVAVEAPSGNKQRMTLNFASSVGKSMSWLANQPRWARLVRPEAFIVATSGQRGELRYFKNFEPVPNLNDPSKYAVLSNQLPTVASALTPFNVVTSDGAKLVTADMRMQDYEFNPFLSTREQNSYSTFFRMNMNLGSRLRPKTTN